MANLCIVGAMGRMGQNVGVLAENFGFTVSGALEFKGSPAVGKPFGGVAVTDDIDTALQGADIVIEFALANGIADRVTAYAAHKIPAVIGTTAVSEEGTNAIKEAAKTIPVIHAANFSLGVNLLGELLKKVSAVLGNEYDAEIVEMHHHNKKDAPSGTALYLAKMLEEGRGVGKEKEIYGRFGNIGARPVGEIAIHSLRGGDVVGDHTVIFASEGERIEFTHKAGSRSNFAMGALKAAKYLIGKEPGLYTMADVIGLK